VLLDVGQHPGGALDRHQGLQAQAGLGDLPRELVGQVERGGGEPLRATGRVAVLAVAQVALDDRLEARVVQMAASGFPGCRPEASSACSTWAATGSTRWTW
jgi:hypothetical protein